MQTGFGACNTILRISHPTRKLRTSKPVFIWNFIWGSKVQGGTDTTLLKIPSNYHFNISLTLSVFMNP